MLPLPYWLTVLITSITVVVCVTLHYEGLRFLSDKLPMPKHHHRRRIILLILCLMLLHSIEIWIFGLNYFWLQGLEGFGEFAGIEHLGVLDCVYYSASVFTTLGFGDIVTEGPIRFMTGVEAVSGLTFITWSASAQSAYDGRYSGNALRGLPFIALKINPHRLSGVHRYIAGGLGKLGAL